MDPRTLCKRLLANDPTAPSSILTSLTSSPATTPWTNFLNHDDHLDEFELRDATVRHLLSNPSECSLDILTRFVELHSSEELLFGRELIESIADDLSSFLAAAASPSSSWRLLESLLRRPRNVDVSTLRERIVLPLSSKGDDKATASSLAEILCDSIAESVLTLPHVGDAEEVSMKRETAALTKLQDWREVIENISKSCVSCFKDGGDDEEEDGRRIVEAFARVYDVAPFALESQLETLLEDEAIFILSKFVKPGKEDDDDEEEGIDVAEEEDAVQLSPLYSATASPLHLSPAQLEATLIEIHDKLSITDSERWDERLSALIDLERILASSSLDVVSRGIFIDKLRKMPIPQQFCDLRSQVTHMACRVLICTSYEYRMFVREDPALASPLHHFVEHCLGSLLKLCTSGTRLMSSQGVNCLLALCATSPGHSRLLTVLCEEIIDKKIKNNNRKRGAVMGVTAALRVWEENHLKNVDLIGNAVREANSNRDPGVREEGRKAYWAMVSCGKTCGKAEELYAVNSREYRNLVKCRGETDAEWEEEGRLGHLVRTGVLLDETKAKSVAATADGKNAAAPPRSMNPNKRPVSAGTRERTTPAAKAGRFSTPAKVPSEMTASSSKRASVNCPMSTPSATLQMNTPGPRHPTFAAASASKICVVKTPSMKSERKSMAVVNGRHVDSTTKVKGTPIGSDSSTNVIQSTLRPDPILFSPECRQDQKENSPTTPTNHSSPKVGTPIVSLLARPSPLSIEKCRSNNALKKVVSMLSDSNNPSEQYLGIQVLALFAKDKSEHESWESMFGVVLDVLLDFFTFITTLPGQIKNTQTDQGYGAMHFPRSPSKNLGSRHEAQHLFLQGIRSLLQFVPGRFNEKQVKEVMICLLECTNAPFEIVHTCERALQNLVTCTNPDICFDCLLSFLLNTEVDLSTDANPPLLLSALRTLKHLIEFISPSSLRQVLPGLLQLFHSTLRHKSVDMRKATVFIIVEMFFVLGNELDVDGFSEGQRRLIDVYVERHPKRNAMVA